MKKTLMLVLGTILITIFACKKELEFRTCDSLLRPCAGSPNGEYCLFGYKWGELPQFEPNGIEAEGPQISGGQITYSFQTKKQKISIHNRQDVKTKDFDSKGSCAREKVITAFKEYAVSYTHLTLPTTPYV